MSLKGSTQTARGASLMAVLEEAYSPNKDTETNIINMLTDLRHLCFRQGYDFANLDQQAAHYYHEETKRDTQ